MKVRHRVQRDPFILALTLTLAVSMPALTSSAHGASVREPAPVGAPDKTSGASSGELVLSSPKRTRVRGTNSDKVCTIEATLELLPGQRAVAARLENYDSANCTAEVVTGDASSSPSVAAPPDTAQEDNLRALAAAAALTHKRGQLHAYAEDVVGIDVNWVKARVEYDYNGTRIYNAITTYGNCTGHRGWLTTTIWYLMVYNHFCQYENNYKDIHSSAYGRFGNDFFCAGLHTEDAFARANIWGNHLGTLRSTVGWQLIKACPLPINNYAVLTPYFY